MGGSVTITLTIVFEKNWELISPSAGAWCKL
jgi:hypothetical protein